MPALIAAPLSTLWTAFFSSRWRQYYKERSPGLAVFPIALLHALLPYAAFGEPISWPRSLLAALGIFLVLRLMRLMDEVKDYPKDITLHPERPLPRGLIPLPEARRAIASQIKAGVVVTIALVLIWGAAQYALTGIIFLGLMAFCYGMYREFGIPETLHHRVFLNAYLHQLVVFLIFSFCNLMALRGSAVHAFSPVGWGILLTGFGASFVYEVCRKLDPKASPALQTYLVLTGKKVTVMNTLFFLAIIIDGAVFLPNFVILVWASIVQIALLFLGVVFFPKLYKLPAMGSVLLYLTQLLSLWILHWMN